MRRWKLARRLTALAPGDLGKVLFAPGGTEAIGMALKLARVATGRHKTVSMWDSFHGASLDAISIGGEAVFRAGIGPLLPGTEHAPPCDPKHCVYGCGGTCNARCAEYIEYILGKEEDVAAVVIETVRSTDVQVPPRAYYETVRRACDRHGALLILDEIPICLGRTGSMFAFERYGIVPDMVVIGKGLGGGVFPMAALIARERLDVAGDRALGHYTHEKSPVGCAAALATLEVIEEEKLLERARVLGERALAHLRAIQKRQRLVSEVRGAGLLLAVELADPASGAPAREAAEDVLYRCLEKGAEARWGRATCWCSCRRSSSAKRTWIARSQSSRNRLRRQDHVDRRTEGNQNSRVPRRPDAFVGAGVGCEWPSGHRRARRRARHRRGGLGLRESGRKHRRGCGGRFRARGDDRQGEGTAGCGAQDAALRPDPVHLSASCAGPGAVRGPDRVRCGVHRL